MRSLPRNKRDGGTRWLPCLIAAVVVGSGGCASRAPRGATTPTRPSDWSAVEALAPGTRVVVERQGGTALSGAASDVTTSSIEIDADGRAHVVLRSQVDRVLRLHSGVARGAARGLAIGGVGGVLQGLLLTQSDRLLFAGLFGAGWAAIGATVGAIGGAGDNESTVVYVAPAAMPPSGIRWCQHLAQLRHESVSPCVP